MLRSAVAAVLVALAAPALAVPSQIHLGWEGATDTTVVVTWRSTEPTGAVAYGVDAAMPSQVAASSVAYDGSWLHRAELTGLAPGTAYRYRCGAEGAWSADLGFTTAPPHGAATAFRFAAYGDSRTDDAARARVRAAVQAAAPAFSIHTGDLVEDGTAQALWDEWFTTMEPLVSTTPLMATLGNHDATSPLWFQQLAMPSHAPPAAGYDDRAYYSFDYGNTHFVALDTDPAMTADDAQSRWLDADLGRADADPAIRWKVVFLHRPPYSSGVHGGSADIAAAWVPIFDAHRVDVVFGGHDHDYERTLPLAAGEPVAQGGTVYVVSGGAGAPLYAVGTSSFTAYSKMTYHFVKVDVSPEEMALEARDDSGALVDAATLVKPVAPPPGADGGTPADGGDPGSDGGDPGSGGAPVVTGGCAVGGGASAVALVAVALAALLRRRRR